MPFLDAERFIDEAIQSVIDQVGFDDWELLLIDDGSSDASTEIARRWVTRDPARIRYLEHPGHANRGRSASRNLGLQASEGEYVAFLDADDVWLPSMLKQRVAVLSQHLDADVVFGAMWVWHSWTGRLVDRFRDQIWPIPTGFAPLATVHAPALFHAVFGSPQHWQTPGLCALFARRRALVDIGGFDPFFTEIYEDQVLYARICTDLAVVLDDRPLALYRQHPDSACTRAIAAGEYHPERPNAAEDRFLEWLEHDVRNRFGELSPQWQTIKANGVVSGGAVAPLPLRQRLRIRLGAVGERITPRLTDARRSLRDRGRTMSGQSLFDTWSHQFLAARQGAIGGRVLVVRSSHGGHDDVVAGIPTLATSRCGPLEDAPPASYDCIVLPVSATTPRPDEWMVKAREALAPSGRLLALIAGPAMSGPGRRRRSSPSATELRRTAAGIFRGATVEIEQFGSRRTAGALRHRLPSRVHGVDVDLHEPGVEVLLGLSVAAQPVKHPSTS